MNKRIEDYNKTLPVLEVYRCVQSEGSRFGRPTIAVRTTGCTHRCYFGEGGWCDSWYTSIHPEKGQFCFNDIIKIYDENPHVKEMMLTGGSPTMHPALVNELTHFAYENNIIITINKIQLADRLRNRNPIFFIRQPPFNPLFRFNSSQFNEVIFINRPKD